MSNKDPENVRPSDIVREKRTRYLNRRDFADFIKRLFFMAVFLYILFGVIFGLAMVPDDDMKPRLSGGDLALYYRLQTDYSSGDLIVYRADGKEHISRVVARGGDSVEITDDGNVIINASVLIEDRIYYKTAPYDSGIVFPVVLGRDEIFVLSDYREGAKDSRYYGPVKKPDIKGKVITVIRRNSL
ncbi:signal peptidase I [Butyrivibrio sp. MC2013]|uniref:signal peptidase I n=1 Tax=Butyrivibrio sp. MC2013 TaxID=1280686 RepID=UPI00041B8309|nr:signal peptidase I [Butyrivibrio sp. MC2013]